MREIDPDMDEAGSGGEVEPVEPVVPVDPVDSVDPVEPVVPVHPVDQDRSCPNRIYFSENLAVLRDLPSGSVDLAYIDPPFNTGRPQRHQRLRTVRSADGDRVGFQGARYTTVPLESRAFDDEFADYPGFLEPRLREAHRILAPDGCLYVHLDYREVHYCKVLLDSIFGRACFLNEIIWAYDYGARATKKWPAKHDTILFYVKNPTDYHFDLDAVERIPYMAPGLVGPEKAARGKTPTDTWWHTIVPTNGKERLGYPTQKPVGILERIVNVSSKRGDLVLDFFAGSGTTGEACLRAGRRFILIDDNEQALDVMARRFAGRTDIEWIGFSPPVPESASGQGGLFVERPRGMA